MAMIDPVMQIRYCVLFLPIAKLVRVGNLAELTVFGLSVYQRVGNRRSLLGLIWDKQEPE